MSHWGYLQSIDLSNCPKRLLTDKEWLSSLLLKLCKEIDMVPYGKPVIDRFGDGTLEGVSGFLFIMTSSITIHCDEVNNQVFIDIFSCKPFNPEASLKFLLSEFKTSDYRQSFITRG